MLMNTLYLKRSFVSLITLATLIGSPEMSFAMEPGESDSEENVTSPKSPRKDQRPEENTSLVIVPRNYPTGLEALPADLIRHRIAAHLDAGSASALARTSFRLNQVLSQQGILNNNHVDISWPAVRERLRPCKVPNIPTCPYTELEFEYFAKDFGKTAMTTVVTNEAGQLVLDQTATSVLRDAFQLHFTPEFTAIPELMKHKAMTAIIGQLKEGGTKLTKKSRVLASVCTLLQSDHTDFRMITRELLGFLDGLENPEDLSRAVLRAINSQSIVCPPDLMSMAQRLSQHKDIENVVNMYFSLYLGGRTFVDFERTLLTLNHLKNQRQVVSACQRLCKDIPIDNPSEILETLDTCENPEEVVSAFIRLRRLLGWDPSNVGTLCKAIALFAHPEELREENLKAFSEFFKYSSDWVHFLKTCSKQETPALSLAKLTSILEAFQGYGIDQSDLSVLLHNNLLDIEALKVAKVCADKLHVKSFVHLAKELPTGFVCDPEQIDQIVGICAQITDADFISEDDAKIYLLTYLLTHPDMIKPLVSNPNPIALAEAQLKGKEAHEKRFIWGKTFAECIKKGE